MAKNRNKQEDLVNVEIPEQILENIILSIYSSNYLVNRKFISNIDLLFTKIDETVYEESSESIFIKYFFIQKSVKGYLEDGIRDMNILYDYAVNNKYGESIDEIVYPMLSDVLENVAESIIDSAEIEYIASYISEHIQYIYLYEQSGNFINVFEKLLTHDFESLKDINTESKAILKSLMSDIRRSEIDKEEAHEFDLSDGNYENMVSTFVKELQNPSRILTTGFKSFDTMWNGGLETSRTQLLLTVSGGGKSKFALNLAEAICVCNTDIELKDPLKRPCVVLLHQENSQRETFGRYFNIKTNEKYDIAELSEEEVLEILRENGVSADRDINLKIIFKKTKSISTDDVYSIIESIEDKGDEVICLIHDYTKRIRPSKPTNDLRIDLGNVVDEFSTMSKVLDIPIVLFGQLNREAMRIVETALNTGVQDIVKLLGSNNIGESALMIENADSVTILQDEYCIETERWFLTAKNVKSRGAQSKITSFAHPYLDSLNTDKDSESRLVLNMDYFSEKPVYKLSMTTNSSNEKPSKAKSFRKKNYIEHDDVDPIELD